MENLDLYFNEKDYEMNYKRMTKEEYELERKTLIEKIEDSIKSWIRAYYKGFEQRVAEDMNEDISRYVLVHYGVNLPYALEAYALNENDINQTFINHYGQEEVDKKLEIKEEIGKIVKFYNNLVFCSAQYEYLWFCFYGENEYITLSKKFLSGFKTIESFRNYLNKYCENLFNSHGLLKKSLEKLREHYDQLCAFDQLQVFIVYQKYNAGEKLSVFR